MDVIQPRRLVAFDLATGNRVGRVPGDFTYTEEVNAFGEIKVSSKWTQEVFELNAWQNTKASKTILGVLEGNEVICAGPVTDRDPTPAGFQINATATIWSFLERRFALNPVLQRTFRNGEVLIDEENPSPEWFLQFQGSLVDIAGDLVDTAVAWGRLPISSPEREGGFNTRTYNGWEFPTIASRLSLITGVINGPELRFKPRLREDGGIWFDMQGAVPELIDNVHNWNTTVPASRVQLIRVPEDASRLATDVWAFGGRSEDVVVAARSTSTVLTSQGYPEMQTVLTGLDTVSDINTLLDHTQERISRSNVEPGVFEFLVGRELNVRPGDWANVRIADKSYGRGVVPLKILRIEGDGKSEYIKAFGRRRTSGL